MTITVQIDAKSYRKHADEQGGIRASVEAMLRSDILEALNNVLPTYASCILTGNDVGMSVKVRDGYDRLPNNYGTPPLPDTMQYDVYSEPCRFLNIILNSRN